MRPVSKGIIPALVLWALLLACLCSPVLAENDEVVTIAVQRAKEAGVAESVLNHLLVLGYKYNLRSTGVAEFIRLTREARAQALPVEPLVSKIEEGLAKRVQVRLIQEAVRQELSHYSFVRNLANRVLKRWNMPIGTLTDKELVRLTKTMSMGISEQDMTAFFEHAPPASMEAFTNGLEFIAALKQAGLSPEATNEIVFAGLEKGYLSTSAWNLALTINAAKRSNVTEENIKATALEVVRGNKSVQEAQKALGIDPKDMGRGPQFVSPGGRGSNMDHGRGSGKGESGGAEHGAGGGGHAGGGGGGDNGHGGGAGSGGDSNGGGAGSEGDGNGGGAGSGGSGGGAGSGGGPR